jgi:hypothetical protein
MIAAFITAAVLHVFVAIARRPGSCGTIGRKIRQSDWLAWRDAMNEKEQELEQLRKLEPKQ